jgi:hypothetical protein
MSADIFTHPHSWFDCRHCRSLPVACLHSTYFQKDTLCDFAAAAKGLQMQNNIEMKNSAVKPRPIEPRILNGFPRKIPRPPTISGSGFTREEMRQIVAEQID